MPKKSKTSDHGKRAAGTVELTEAQLDQVDGGLLPARTLMGDGSVKPTDQSAITDGTSNTILFGEKLPSSTPSSR